MRSAVLALWRTRPPASFPRRSRPSCRQRWRRLQRAEGLRRCRRVSCCSEGMAAGLAEGRCRAAVSGWHWQVPLPYCPTFILTPTPLHTPSIPPAGLLAVPGAAPADGKTPGGHLLSRRPSGRVYSDDAVQRRATRHAGGGEAVDDSLLHTDPEAAARHIRALKKAQAEAASQQASQQPLEAAVGAGGDVQDEAAPGTEQQQQRPPMEEEEEEVGVAAVAAGMQEREVLVESTKENLPEAAAAAVAATPVADATTSVTAAKHAAKGTLTAVVQQHGSSRLRWEGGADGEAATVQEQQPGGAQQKQQQEQQPTEEAEVPAAFEPSPADHARVERLQAALVQETQGMVLDSLESVHAKLSRLAMEQRRVPDRDAVVEAALAAVRAWRAARQQA